MGARHEEAKLATMKFGIGQPVPRSEDPTLLRGEGRYTDDIDLPGQAYAAIVRSPFAHGTITGLDAGEARAMPGVLAVYGGAELAGYGGMKCGLPLKGSDGEGIRFVPRPPLAVDRVRYVGDPVAVVVAETAAQARDAAETVMLDVESLPAMTTAAQALATDAPRIYDELPDNVALDYHYGDADAVAAAFAEAAHVTLLELDNNRVVVSAMEPRAAIGSYDPADGRWTLNVGCQGAFGLRNQLKDILGVEAEQVHVLTGNVGGSFGMKASVYPEYVCVLHAARGLGRPVKWTDDRSGAFLSDFHGRAHAVTGELALDAEGRFLAVRITGTANVGAYLSPVGPMMSTLNIVKNVVGTYRTPLVEVATRVTYTNTPPVTAYRGAGRPEGNYYMQRLIDAAAAEIGLDRVELRRRNLIAPDAFPYAAPSGMTYDSGDFPALFEQALRLADWDGFDARAAESRARGRLRGRGIGSYLEVTAPPSGEMGGIRFEDDDTVTIITGTLDYGQGHATPFAQVLHQKLGVPFERVRLLQGDSDELIAGGGTGGSRSITASGAAILQAGDRVIEQSRAVAAHVLEAAVEDIEFVAGRFVIAGTDRAVGIMELAEQLRDGLALPEGLPATLDVSLVHDPIPSAFPNGCHIAEVEVDPETGVVEVVKYEMVNDFGTVINPLLVEGQAHGGVVQGIGQALMERVVFDDEGQLVTGSYMDYAVPRADAAPDFVLQHHAVPAKTNPLGSKGCGEAGCAGALPAVMNALVDALSVYGIRHIDMPATPQRVWQAIQAARPAQAAE